MSAFLEIFKRDIVLAYKESGGALACIGFFVISYTLSAFAVGADEHQRLLFPILCTLITFATLLSLGNLFARDEEDGTLEQYAMLPLAPELLVLCKLLAFVTALNLPLVMVAWGIYAVQGLTFTPSMAFRLLLLGVTLAAIGTLSAALSLLSKRTQLVQTLIALPLMAPVVIFAVLPDGAAILAAVALIALPASAWIASCALKP